MLYCSIITWGAPERRSLEKPLQPKATGVKEGLSGANCLHNVGHATRQEWSQPHQILAATASRGRHVGRERLPTPRVIAVVKKGHPGSGRLLQLTGCLDGEQGGDERAESDVRLHGSNNV